MANYFLYSDINIDLTTNYVYNLDSVKQSINTLLTTRLGSRLFLSEYGTDIESFLYEPCDRFTAACIFTEVIAAITRWEPRVILDNASSAVLADPVNQRFIVNLVYRVVGYDDQKFQYVMGVSR
jgi:phage baseplate assembly protein W